MRKFLTVFVLAVSLTTTGFAQTPKGRITGIVIDGNTKTIESATITLLHSKDSSVAKVSVADKSGKFVFDAVKEGKYLVSISAVGHVKGFTEVFEVTSANSNITLKTIELVPSSKELGGITIIAKKPLIEMKTDKMVVNVEASPTNVGANALEVLEKSPGIIVDRDGNISLKGKSGVQIYIDGRPSYLSGADLANMLRTMNASQLEQIEIMTNPPAKYDAAGNSGVINIKTKKNKQFGYNGSVSLGYGQGRYPKLNESVTFNYRKNKVNLFANAGYSYRKNFNDLDIQRNFIEKGSGILTSIFEQESRIRENSQSFNAKAGMDFYASKKTTLGFVVSGYTNPNEFKNTSDINIYNANHDLQSITKAYSAVDGKWKNISTNLNFRHQFDSTGKELTADVDYLQYNKSASQVLINSYYDKDGFPNHIPDTLLGNLPQDIKIYTVKTDYVHPLKKGAKLEMGLKTSFVKTDNNAQYDSLLNGNQVPDFGRTNYFVYEENINAAYINFSKPLTKKFNMQLGLRLENTSATGHSTGRINVNDVWIQYDSIFKRNYTQLFPTAFFQYTLDKSNVFGLNYGRRIQRPNYQDLNPFIFFLDRYTFEQGNPNLKPQFSHNIELTHTFKGFLSTTINYTKTTDIIEQVLEQHNDKNQTFVKKYNIANLRQYGISMNAGGPVKKWWSVNVFANVYNNFYSGIINGDYTEIGATTGQFNVSNQFKFGKGWSAELSGFYTTPMVNGVFKIQDFGALNAGIGKQVMKGKGTVRVNARDILYTQKIRGTSRFSNIDAAFQQQRDSRVVNVNFTYRFSKGKVNGQKRRTGGATEEQNRVKTGEN